MIRERLSDLFLFEEILDNDDVNKTQNRTDALLSSHAFWLEGFSCGRLNVLQQQMAPASESNKSLMKMMLSSDTITHCSVQTEAKGCCLSCL